MAAMAESGRPSKVQVRSCLTCTNRLSDLCYDTHTLCEKCRYQVCGYNSFCDECRSWSNDFRRMYVKHQRTLYQKPVSKGKARAKSPPVADDSASNISIESHVSVPVVILPLDSQSVNIDDELGNIQNIDSEVEIQQPQPEVVVVGLRLVGINDSLHKTVLVHETFQAIVPITVASPEIAHVSDSPLAIILTTDGDSLQGIPLLLRVGDSLQGIPPLQSASDSLQRIPSLLSIGVHPVPPLVMPPLRDPLAVFSCPALFSFQGR